jgi:hypothetical protein
MQRSHLECIQDFPLDGSKVIVEINNYRDRPEGAGGIAVNLNLQDQFQEKPISYVYDYIVRSELANLLEQPWMTAACEKAKKQAEKESRNIYEDADFKEEVEEERKNRHKVWAYTKLKKEYVYEFFSKATEAEASKEKGRRPKSRGFYPEQFQPVMATERMLSEMYKEAGLQSFLRAAYEKKDLRSLYESLFGSFEDTLASAPFLENTFSKLPTGVHTETGGIPVKLLRRVLSPSLASVAAYFAFACYDETSINKAYALLQKNMIFYDKLEDEDAPPEKDLQMLFRDSLDNYLFHQTTMEDGSNFVNNVVKPTNRLAFCVSKHARTRPPGKGTTAMLSRLQSHLFRTMCSDIVDIYVSHGCYPRCGRSISNLHPDLITLIKRHHEVERDPIRPVPLLLEYVMKLIAEREVQVRSSHYFVVNPPRLIPYDGNAAQGKKQVVYDRPKTNEIRYLYNCSGLMNRSEPPEPLYVTLPELVNVILFKMLRPLDSGGVGHVIREWPASGSQIIFSNPAMLWDTPVNKDHEHASATKATQKKGSEHASATKATQKKGSVNMPSAMVTSGWKGARAKKATKAVVAKKTRRECEEVRQSSDSSDSDEEEEEVHDHATATTKAEKKGSVKKQIRREHAQEGSDSSGSDEENEEDKEGLPASNNSDDETAPTHKETKMEEEGADGAGVQQNNPVKKFGDDTVSEEDSSSGEESTGVEDEITELKNQLKNAQRERDEYEDDKEFYKEAHEYVLEKLKESEQKAEKADRDLTEAVEAAESQAKRIKALEAEILLINARDTRKVASVPDQTEKAENDNREAGEVLVSPALAVTNLGLETEHPATTASGSRGVRDQSVVDEAAASLAQTGGATMPDQNVNKIETIEHAHDKYVEACSVLLDYLHVREGSVAVQSHHPTWESVSNMSKVMTTLSELQLHLLSKGKTLSVGPYDAEMTSNHNRMRDVMLDFQRVVYSPLRQEIPSGYVQKRNVRGDKGDYGAECHDCLEWMERLFDKGTLTVLEQAFMKDTRCSGLKVVEAGDVGVTNDAASEFPGRLHGLKDGLFVPWVTDPREKTSVTADDKRTDKSSGFEEQKPTDLKRKANETGLCEVPRKKKSGG